MFNKLRNRFLIVSMSIISFMLLASFISIYVITYQSVNKDIDVELHSMSKFYRESNISDDKQQDKDKPLKQGLSLSFEMQTDKKWNITNTESLFDFNREFYEAAKNKVSTNGSTEGRYELDGSKWAYIVLEENSGYSIYSLDITARLNILMNLIYTFIAVGFVMLIIIFLTNRFFANRYIAPIKEAFNKQKQFIADASHELKTPLTVIHTTADVLLANSDDTIRNQSKWLYHIKSETERMKALTNDLLYLTEIDHTQPRMLFATFNVSEAIESVILTMEAVIFEKDIMLHYEIEPNLTAHGNAEQIKQLVMILLDNGIKYNNPKGSITLTLKKRNLDIVLSVTNTGKGISSEHLEKIFDRFYRTDTSRSRQHGGYGLGLAIAKSIVEQHKGKIYAKSTWHESTTFYVHFH